MGLMHEFFIMSKKYVNLDELAKSSIIDRSKAASCIGIADDFILDNADVLGKNAGFTSALDGKKGLAYYWITVLYANEINNFINAMADIPDCAEKELLTACGHFAVEKDCYLIHFGI